MDIPAYQIHKVMKVYTKQLSQSKIIERQKAIGQKSSTDTDKVNISDTGKRQAVIDKVAENIVNRITQFGPKDEVEHEIVNQLQEEIGRKVDFKEKQNAQFVFNVIDEKNKKTTTSLSVEDTGFLLKRLEELAKEIVDKKMEPIIGVTNE